MKAITAFLTLIVLGTLVYCWKPDRFISYTGTDLVFRILISLYLLATAAPLVVLCAVDSTKPSKRKRGGR